MIYFLKVTLVGRYMWRYVASCIMFRVYNRCWMADMLHAIPTSFCLFFAAAALPLVIQASGIHHHPSICGSISSAWIFYLFYYYYYSCACCLLVDSLGLQATQHVPSTTALFWASLLAFNQRLFMVKRGEEKKKSHIKIYEISILTSFHFSTSKQRNFFSVTIWALFSWASVQLGQSLHVDSTFSRVCCLWLLLHFSQYFISLQHLIWAAPALVEVFTSPPLWTEAQLKEVNLRSR